MSESKNCSPEEMIVCAYVREYDGALMIVCVQMWKRMREKEREMGNVNKDGSLSTIITLSARTK